jgi:hypothetical protein
MYLFHARGRRGRSSLPCSWPGEAVPLVPQCRGVSRRLLLLGADVSARNLPQHTLFVIAVAALVKPTGAYMARVISHQRLPLELRPKERR